MKTSNCLQLGKEPGEGVASLRRHSWFFGLVNLPPLRTSAVAKGTFLSLCLLASRSRLWTLPQRSAVDYVKILQPRSERNLGTRLKIGLSNYCVIKSSHVHPVNACDHFSSSKQTCKIMQNWARIWNKPNKRMSAKGHVHYLSPRIKYFTAPWQLLVDKVFESTDY